MTKHTAIRHLVALAACSVLWSAEASSVVGQGVPRQTGNSFASAQGSAPPTDLHMVNATITAVDTVKHTLTLVGQPVGWDTSQLKVFTATGKPTTVDQLTAGMNIRFALQPTQAANRKIVLIRMLGS